MYKRGETCSIGRSTSYETAKGGDDDFDDLFHDVPDLSYFVRVHTTELLFAGRRLQFYQGD